MGVRFVSSRVPVGRHEVLLPVNHNLNKICDIQRSFLKSKQKKFQEFFFLLARTVQLSNYLGMTTTVLLNYKLEQSGATVHKEARKNLPEKNPKNKLKRTKTS